MRRSRRLWANSQGMKLAVTAATLILSGAAAEAQSGRVTPIAYDRDQQRSIINDLSDGFMEGFSSRRLPSSPSAIPNPQTPTAQMRAVRPLLRDFSDEMAQLGYLLNEEVRRQPSIRSLYTQALNLSGIAVSLDKHAQRFNDHTLLQDEFRQLDAQWRELAYRLGNVPSLRREVLTSIATLNDLSEQIRNAIGIRPQINRRDLYQKANDLARDLGNLIEDVQVELPGNEGRQIQVQLSRARQQILNLAALFEDETVDMDLIINEYKQFQALWYPQRAKLQQYDNRYFERSLRRITQTDGEIHQLLLLPTKVDDQQLIYLTSALKKDIDEFFDRMSLRLMMNLRKADMVPGVASEFYGVCEHFIDSVQNQAKYSDLVESFRYIESAERNFVDVFGDIQSREALAALRQISQTIATLRSAMAVPDDGFNRQQAIDLAAQSESLTEQLEWVANRWLSRDRQPFASACLSAIRRMRDDLDQLHQNLVVGGSSSQHLRQIESIYSTWREVYSYLIKCQTEDRQHLGRLASRITPALVELRTTLTQ